MRFRHTPRRRPPWWPDDHPWPPSGPPDYYLLHRMRRRLFWRVGVFFLFVLFIIIAGCISLFWLVASWFGLLGLPGGQNLAPQPVGPPFFLRFWWLAPLALLAIGVATVASALRHAAVPLGELMEAAGRVAGGDYTTRVRESGPREVRALARAFNEMSSRLHANDEQRRNLLADVTHELRTPLTVIQGNLEGLLDGVYPRDDSHLITVLDETRLLSRLVEDLRTLSLAEAGALRLQKEPTDLAALIDQVVDKFRPQAQAAGVSLRISVPTDLPSLEVDVARIREVLENLISNALRFTPHDGEIRVECSINNRQRLAEVSVSDNGVGIPQEDLPFIFDRFHKSHDTHGMGLGLAIAKNLVAAHGGEISAESKPGNGTTIRFTLPLDSQ